MALVYITKIGIERRAQIWQKMRRDSFVNYKTNRYKLHLYETTTGIKILLNTDVNVVNDVNEYLHNIYKLYVDLVVKNPVTEIGEPVESELFCAKLNTYIQSLPIYS